jgi:hypothetical protein
MLQKKVIAKSQGATTGMGICHFFISLFEANELLPDKQKMTDKTIAKKVVKEFPDRKSAQDFIALNPNKTVNSYRYRYNKGKFTKDIPPETLSLRYSEKGLPVNFKTGTIILSQEEVTQLRTNHRLFRHQIMESLL